MAAASNQIEELKEAFNAFDTDGSEVISASELRNVIKKLNIQADENEYNALLSSLDKNGDGNITFAEFAKVMGSKYYSKKDKNTLADEFKKYDIDHSGTISVEDLHAVLSKSRGNFNLADAKTLIAKADKNGDGRINIAEFLGLFD